MRRVVRLLLVTMGVAGPGCGGQADSADPPLSPGDLYVDHALEWGLGFTHFNGMTGDLFFPEMTGQGAALLDYDGDGDLDAYLIQGARLDGVDTAESVSSPTDRLFRNDPIRDTTGAWRPSFVDVTVSAGLESTGYGMGVAVGDVDGDGWLDIYVTNYGVNQLWRNRGDGTFEEVSRAAGVDDALWGTSATFIDIDGDSDPDLYLTNYVEFDVKRNPRCFSASSRRDYCGPADFPPQPDRLYRNRGDGTFEDRTRMALVDYVPGPGLGVIAADFNQDGWQDFLVANDGALNQLWINRGDGVFTDEALLAGVAANRMGEMEASMGVTAADFDGDGDEDLFLTHLMGETNTLYRNDGGGFFEDRTVELGLAAGSLGYTSFGTAFLDANADGWLDLIILNGAVRQIESQVEQGIGYPLQLPNQLYLNRNGRQFEEWTELAGPAFRLAEVSRGAAVGDIDNDGRVDVLISNNNGPARLLVNTADDPTEWLGVRVLDHPEGTDALGARIEVIDTDGRSLWRWVRAGGSYCSSSDPRVSVALGAGARVETVRLIGSAGRVRQWRGFAADHYWITVQPGALEAKP